MGLFKKKKEISDKEINLPELPELPELPGLSGLPELPGLSQPHEQENLSETRWEPKNLPSIPGEISSDFNRQAVKTAVSTHSPEEARKNRLRRTMEIEEWQKSEKLPQMQSSVTEITSERKSPILPTYYKTVPSVKYPEQKQIKKAEPVYVRIDKFRLAAQNFQEIKKKVLEVENLLKDIRDMKQREDEELRAWEHEIEGIKTRIEGIDRNIFSKLD